MIVERRMPIGALIGLGLTQIIGYGTLYYAFSVLVPEIALDLGKSEQWVFGAFSAALLIGGFAAPLSGRWADRIGAGKVMTAGSVAAALSLLAAASAPDAISFLVALILMQVVSATVLYATAFTAVVQIGGPRAQTSIVHLTLIAGFASTIFWPVTSWLHSDMSWREIFYCFAAINLIICVPVHFGIGRLAQEGEVGERVEDNRQTFGLVSSLPDRDRKIIFLLMLAGFAIQGYALSAILVHMVPLTQAIGLGASGLFIASLFGPSQVASRLINLVLGSRLSQARLAVISALLLPCGIAILLVTAPAIPGAVAFAICVGMGSGLTSIVGGTLPLELFGRRGYGKLMGWGTLARQIASAIAPLGMAMTTSSFGVQSSLLLVITVGAISVLAFVGIVWRTQPRRGDVASVDST